MVKAAYSCGKPALGVVPETFQLMLKKSANIRQAAHDIVMSKSFDNGMVCALNKRLSLIKKFTMNL